MTLRPQRLTLHTISTLLALFALFQVSWPARAAERAEVGAKILALENTGRARARESADALELLLPSTEEFSAERLELLTVQGLMLGMAALPASTEVVVPRLEDWGAASSSPLALHAKAAASLVRGCFMARSGNVPGGVMQLELALTTLPEGSSARERYRFFAMAAFVNKQAGNFEVAVRLGHEALALADRTDERWRQAEIRSVLAYTYFSARQVNPATKLGEEAIVLAEKSQDALSMARAYSTVGSILGGTGDLEGQGSYNTLAAKHARRAGSPADEVLFLANLADFFLKKSAYADALATSERALVLARELGDKGLEALALFNIGISHISLKQVDLGKRFCEQSMQIDRERGLVKSVAESQRELGAYLEKTGDLPAAMQAYLAYRRVANALLGSEQQKAILASQEQYDAERRKRLLEQLSKENDINAERLLQSDIRQRLWWLLAVAFSLSFIAIALLYQRIKYINRTLEASNQQLKELGERDPLTGLANRRYLETAMRQLEADVEVGGTVYLVDVDHFKRINDSHGHAAGDDVLVEVSRRLRASLRDHDLIARWGGEEFLIVVQSLEQGQVDTVAQRMLDALADEPVTIGPRDLQVTASIGYADFALSPDRPGISWEKAIEVADAAMYLAKQHGRSRAYGVHLSASDPDPDVDAITSSLERAQRDGQIALTLLLGPSAPPVQP